MKYQIVISGMHCSGCKNLITMSLEDVGFNDVLVDSEKNTAQFSSESDQKIVENKLTEIFKELAEYKYSNLTIIS